MSDNKTPCQATPAATLREQIMDSRIAKSEREWWAARTIEKLERERDQLRAEVERLRAGIAECLHTNGHLADGENCTLISLKRCLHDPTAAREGREMSDTPRTDAKLFDPIHYFDQGGSSYGQMRRVSDGDHVPVEVARQLERELAEAKKDTARIDWLADPSNSIGIVSLPKKYVLNNLHCMRAAIDAAMEGDK